MKHGALFISYARADAIEFATRLSNDLKRWGFAVWVDLSELENGALFDVSIENAIQTSSILLASMSKASLMDKSVCRDEIVFALNSGKQLLPLKIQSDVEPSLLLARRQWIDFSTSYDSGIEILLEFLQGNTARLNEPSVPIVDGVVPLDFSPEIARLTKRFTGRTWLFEQIRNQLENAEDNRPIVLVAEPGFGKSAIVAELSFELDQEIAGLHFCTRRKTKTLSPSDFVASLVAQMSVAIPEYGKIIKGLQENSLICSNPSDAFREFIVEPLRLTSQHCRRLVAIDGLDEAEDFEGETIAEVLGKHAIDLPDWLVLVITTRPENPVLRQLRHLNLYFLDADATNNTLDVEE